MNDTYIVAGYVLIDEVLKAIHYQDDARADVSDAEVLAVAGMVALFSEPSRVCLVSAATLGRHSP
jgi:hypothetical protein